MEVPFSKGEDKEQGERVPVEPGSKKEHRVNPEGECKNGARGKDVQVFTQAGEQKI
ncbi:hypothetical protein ACLBKS_11920 [Hylemonella sp. W303a]|uniref:hypothetical protein n=1 Tax=Hylemonella sp. W303a TaxID=3389873 RepID=UPI00396B0AA8